MVVERHVVVDLIAQFARKLEEGEYVARSVAWEGDERLDFACSTKV